MLLVPRFLFPQELTKLTTMKHQPQKNVKAEVVSAFGSEKTTIQWWRRPENSSHFMMRRFEIGSNGKIGIHGHPEEHQMYVLKGPIILLDKEGKKTQVETDEFVYMPPDEMHGYFNPNEYTVSFICCIPKLSKTES